MYTPIDNMLLSPTSGIHNLSGNQFFTPTTKQILKQVDQECLLAASTSSAHSAVKRSIHLGTLTVEDVQNVPSSLPDEDFTRVIESPKKKN